MQARLPPFLTMHLPNKHAAHAAHAANVVHAAHAAHAAHVVPSLHRSNTIAQYSKMFHASFESRKTNMNTLEFTAANSIKSCLENYKTIKYILCYFTLLLSHELQACYVET